MNNIFDWNHISDRLSEDERDELNPIIKSITENVGLLSEL